MPKPLTKQERETVMTFNEGDDTGSVFTYKRSFQRTLEQEFGIKPIYDNGYGGKEYIVPKRWIRCPRAPRGSRGKVQQGG